MLLSAKNFNSETDKISASFGKSSGGGAGDDSSGKLSNIP
jgi:hypothetical protein